jgi:hypothetical protein
MGADKKKGRASAWQIENMVQKQIQEAMTGKWFESLFSMRELQWKHANQMRTQGNEWQEFWGWDPKEPVGNVHNEESSDEEFTEMDQLTKNLQQQIQSFVRSVVAKTDLSK